jgi:hypothetical protein
MAQSPHYKTEKRSFIHHKSGKPAVMNIAKIGKSVSKVIRPIRASGQFKERVTVELPYHPASAAAIVIRTMGKTLSIEIANQILAVTR